MKVITATGGVAAIQASADDMLPRHGVLQKDLIALINREYEFNVSPSIPPGVPPQPILIFQSGRFVQEGEKIPIFQINIFPDGVAISAADTNLADVMLEHLISRLDNDLHYRFSETPQMKLYASALVVKFDVEFLEKLTAIRILAGILNETARRPGPAYSLRRLAFSQGSAAESMTFPSVLQAVPPDFFIEPRVDTVSAERTRYFCGAPVRTSEHVALLERIERTIIG